MGLLSCGKKREDLYRLADGEMPESEAVKLREHLETCSFCQKEIKAIISLNQVISSTAKIIQTTPAFEAAFWKRVSERGASSGTPWFIEFLNDLEKWVPVALSPKAVAFALFAFILGNIGGMVSLSQRGFPDNSSPLIRHLTSSQEFKGVPAYSLAAVYSNLTRKVDSS